MNKNKWRKWSHGCLVSWRQRRCRICQRFLGRFEREICKSCLPRERKEIARKASLKYYYKNKIILLKKRISYLKKYREKNKEKLREKDRERYLRKKERGDIRE